MATTTISLNEIIIPEPEVKISANEVISAGFNSSGVGRKMTEVRTPSNIPKMERYDEEIMEQMLGDVNIPVSLRKRLSYYVKHNRTAPSKATVVYERNALNEDRKLGRYSPVGGYGLQSYRGDVRSALTAKYYFDLDLENCHYNIALKFARDLNLKSSAIERYCKHREACLKLFSDNRSVGKFEYLKLLYNGDFAVSREGRGDEWEDHSGQIKPEGVAFRNELEGEVKRLMETLWNANTDLHKHKCGKEKKAIEKRPNKMAILMSLLFQTEEAKCMWVMDRFFTENDRTVGILIHDGVNVEKMAGESEFPRELMRNCETEIAQKLGYSFTITQKPIKNTYVAPPNCQNEYAKMKVEFEKKWFMVGATINQITDDGIRLEHKVGDATIICANKTFMKMNPKTLQMEKTPFLGEWMSDETRKDYQRCDFIPNREKCPDCVFNLFSGFVIEVEAMMELAENGEIDEKEGLVLIEPLLAQMEVMCGGDYTFFRKWLSNLVKNPEVKSDVGLLFRDMGGLLYEGGGTGKNLFVEWFGNDILGEQYFLTVDDNSILYEKHNSLFEGKLLIFVEEADGKDNHANADKLKSKITSKKKTINKKNVAQYTQNDYSRMAAATNNQNALPLRQGDRRFTMFDVRATHRGNQSYFTRLVEAMNNRRVRVAFYQYLMREETWTRPIEFQNNRPITDAYINIRQINAPPHMKWLRYELRHATLPEEATTKELHERYIAWMTMNGREGKAMRPIDFGKLMTEAFHEPEQPELGVLALGEARHTMVGTVRKFDFAKLIEGMEKLHLLAKGECRVDMNKCLIQMDFD